MKPILCNYYLTYRCNSRCTYCDIWQNEKLRGIVDAELSQAKKNIAQVRKAGIRFIDFTGGEPLLYQYLPEVLLFAKNCGLLTSVTTNGLLYEKRAAELKGLVNFLHFSLDALDAKLHNSLRASFSFDRMLRNIDIAKKLGERPDILFTVSDKNYMQIEKLWQFCRQKRLILIVNPVFGYGKMSDLNLECLNYLNRFKNKPNIYINRALHRFRQKGGNQINDPRCRAMSSTIVISPDNKLVVPCFHHATDSIAIQDEISTVLASSAYRSLKANEGKFSFCQGCSISCYLDPSFTFEFDIYAWLSILSKIKYTFEKYILQ